MCVSNNELLFTTGIQSDISPPSRFYQFYLYPFQSNSDQDKHAFRADNNFIRNLLFFIFNFLAIIIKKIKKNVHFC